MSSTDSSNDPPTEVPHVGTCEMKFEVVTLSVSAVDRAKAFYERLGWRCDADIVRGENFPAVQMTPPYSGCSIAVRKGLTSDVPVPLSACCSSWTMSTLQRGHQPLRHRDQRRRSRPAATWIKSSTSGRCEGRLGTSSEAEPDFADWMEDFPARASRPAVSLGPDRGKGRLKISSFTRTRFT
jgi:hypothetical protein